MSDKTTAIKNPLTVISIFAGLAEVAGTVVLPFVADANQVTYIWFLMLFPTLLVLLFFVTLNFNSGVLYAPSDFRDEKNYLAIFRPSSALERLEKIEEDASEDREGAAKQEVAPTSPIAPNLADIVPSRSRIIAVMQNDRRTRYVLAEALVLERLTKEFGVAPQRDLALQQGGRSNIFDAVYELERGIVLVEVKIHSLINFRNRVSEALAGFDRARSLLSDSVRHRARFLLAYVHELKAEKAERVEEQVLEMVTNSGIPIETRFFALDELIAQAEKK